jgi:hypothetical protein
MCPDITFPDVNSSMAVDWHATSGHVSLINNGTICWPLRWQEDISSTTPKNNHVTAMHSSKEASYPHSPTSNTFGSSKALTTSPSNNHPPLTFTHDYQYHPLDCTYQHVAEINPSSLQPADDIVAGVPNNTLTSAKGRHFVASLGLHAK